MVVIFSFYSKQDKVSDKDTKPCVVLYLSSGHFATKYEGDGGDEKKHKHHKQHYSSLFFPGTDISDGLKINVVNETAILLEGCLASNPFWHSPGMRTLVMPRYLRWKAGRAQSLHRTLAFAL